MVRMCCLWGLTLILLIPGGLRGEVCKWVDDAGTVHYEAECPENIVGENFELEAQDGSPLGSEARSPGQLADRDRWARNQPVSTLRSLPPAQSRYLVSSDWRVRAELEEQGARFILKLAATDRLDAGRFLEVRFPDPAEPGESVFAQLTYDGLSPVLRFESPVLRGFKCWAYHVDVVVYEDETRNRVLGKHQQRIASLFDISRARNEREFEEAITGRGNCDQGSREGAESKPDYDRMTLAELRLACAAERETLVKPERDFLIRECIETEGKEPEYCAMFYESYGATEPRGDRRKPLYHDRAPACRAEDARLWEH